MSWSIARPFLPLTRDIVNRGNWLWNPANIKGTNKDARIYVGRSTTVHNLLFCVHTLCMNYETNTLLLVSSSVRSKQLLCFVHGQGQKSKQKHTTKSFDEFHNHSPLLTMLVTFGLVPCVKKSLVLWDEVSSRMDKSSRNPRNKVFFISRFFHVFYSDQMYWRNWTSWSYRGWNLQGAWVSNQSKKNVNNEMDRSKLEIIKKSSK